MTIKQLSVFLENEPGKLAEFATVLSKQNINLRSITVAEAPDFGVVRIIVDDTLNAATLLRSENYVCSVTDVLAIEVQDKPGMMADMIATLGNEGINIDYMYTILGKKKDVAYMIIRVDNNDKAASILNAKGFITSSIDEMN